MIIYKPMLSLYIVESCNRFLRYLLFSLLGYITNTKNIKRHSELKSRSNINESLEVFGMIKSYHRTEKLKRINYIQMKYRRNDYVNRTKYRVLN